MFSGDVIGMVISSRKNEALVGCKLLRVKLNGNSRIKDIIAVDRVGAGMGDNVLVVLGEAARLATEKSLPIDAAIVGIIDPL